MERRLRVRQIGGDSRTFPVEMGAGIDPKPLSICFGDGRVGLVHSSRSRGPKAEYLGCKFSDGLDEADVEVRLTPSHS
ncbi:hypothetical protein H5410_043429 [Solanum commersonii]|uniref:Uncharacterized protein n=1 Tax=Solanum commersonii TaxID=4109 RepID=A0A9J5XX50_SOLCO|nr:hypothetical protein H5410_043429 [Solanum commersonii]